MLESLFQKKSNKYDIYFYDNIYTTRFEPHLLNLKKVIPEELIDLYKPGIASKTCVIKNKWVGFPLTIDLSVLYSNYEILNKYNKSVPKTWDELIETGKYIMNEESKLNNTDILIYNGALSENELGTCSLFEYIHSFRNTNESSFPSFQSQETINALKTLKKIKKELNLDDEFKLDIHQTLQNLESGNFLFIKFWYSPFASWNKYIYNCTNIPGVKEGISGSIIGGFNLGINKYIDKDKLNTTIEVFKFITSKEIQKKGILEYGYYSGIPSLYDDEEICSKRNCEFYRNVQFVLRPTRKDYNNYSRTIRNDIYKYLYGDDDVDLLKILKTIDSITKNYNFLIMSNDSPIGLIIFITVISLFVIYILSLIPLYLNMYYSYFQFLSKDFYLITVVGSLLILSNCFLDFGTKSVFKCHLRVVFISIGLTFCLIPFFYKLIISIPMDNGLIIRIRKKKYSFFF